MVLLLAGLILPAGRAMAEPPVPSIVITLEGYPGDDEPSPPDPLTVPDFSTGLGLSALQQQSLLQRHNDWRSWFNVAPLAWSDELAVSAAHWAAQLAAGPVCGMAHSHQAGVGENIFRASPLTGHSGRVRLLPLYPDQIIDAWGRELDDYQVSSRSCDQDRVCGHFTQLVWSSTREVGCARRICDSLNQVWVCQYRPAGNVRGVTPF